MTSLSSDCHSRAGPVCAHKSTIWAIRSVFLLVSLILGLPALAIDSYELEFLVFAVDSLPVTQTTLNGEALVLLVESAMYRHSLSSKETKILPQGVGRLAAARKAIEAHTGYHVLAHNRILRTRSSPFGKRQYRLLSAVPEFESRLTTYFRLYTTGPFFLQTSILYRPGLQISPAAGLSDSSHNLQMGESLAIQETRRIRFNEMHYLDHPSFGALIVLTPKT